MKFQGGNTLSLGNRPIRKSPNHILRKERLQHGWTQQDVADRIGTTFVNVSRWERGINSPSPYFRQQLCRLFEKEAETLGLLPAIPSFEHNAHIFCEGATSLPAGKAQEEPPNHLSPSFPRRRFYYWRNTSIIGALIIFLALVVIKLSLWISRRYRVISTRSFIHCI
jgi:transcriptional regulator with XRE-family HTH domain